MKWITSRYHVNRGPMNSHRKCLSSFDSDSDLDATKDVCIIHQLVRRLSRKNEFPTLTCGHFVVIKRLEQEHAPPRHDDVDDRAGEQEQQQLQRAASHGSIA